MIKRRRILGNAWWTLFSLLSPEERNSFDLDTSEQGDQDMYGNEDITGSDEDLPEELTEFLSVAFKKPISADR